VWSVKGCPGAGCGGRDVALWWPRLYGGAPDPGNPDWNLTWDFARKSPRTSSAPQRPSDALRLSALRLINAAIKDREIALRGEDDERRWAMVIFWPSWRGW
jgi:hypothetical protein